MRANRVYLFALSLLLVFVCAGCVGTGGTSTAAALDHGSPSAAVGAQPEVPAVPEPEDTAGVGDAGSEAQSAAGQDASRDAVSPDAAGELFLWRLHTADTTMHFLGSFHIATEAVYPLDKRINRAYEKSETLVLEVNLNAEMNLATQQHILQQSMFPDGETLQDHLAPDLYDRILRLVNEYGLASEQVVRFKPWALESALLLLEMQQYGYNPTFGIDMHFLERAAADGREILGLETVREQIELLDGMPLAEQVKSLEYSIREMKRLHTQINELLTAWKEGRLGLFEEMLVFDLESGSEYLYDVLLRQRNESWRDRIIEMVEAGGNYFVVVGAAHLVGPDNLIALLRDSGYTLVRY